MPGSTDGAELTGARESAPDHVAFCRLDGMGAPVEKYFAAQWLGLRVPLSTLHVRPRDRPRMTRGRCGSLRAVAINGAMQIAPVPKHLNISLVDVPALSHPATSATAQTFSQCRRELGFPIADRLVTEYDAAK
jgi:hypothetical protein